jgi:hypothetical protein
MARDDTVLANGTNKPFDPSSALTVIYGIEKPANINNKLTTVAIVIVIERNFLDIGDNCPFIYINQF